MRAIRRYGAIGLLCLPLLALAAGDLQVFTLKHRPADELAAVLQPLAGPDGVVRAAGDQLIVRAGPQAMADIRKALKRLDVAPRQLLISVRQNADEQATRRGAGLSGRVSRDAGGVTVPPRGHGDAGVIARDSQGNVLRGRVTDRDTHRQRNVSQQVRVLAGHTAVIYVGQRVPVRQRTVLPSVGRPVVVDEQRLEDVTTGYRVTPRVHGQQFTLDIAPQMQTLRDHGRRIDVQRLHTSVSGRLGEWVDLGGAVQSAAGSQAGLAGYDAQTRHAAHGAAVMVEALPD